MSTKYFSGRKGQYVFCDICGQAVYVWDSVKLKPETGRGGLIVCKNDADDVDPGLLPISIPAEKHVKWARVNHTDVTRSSSPEDPETSTRLGV